jgi:hypothetical protein
VLNSENVDERNKNRPLVDVSSSFVTSDKADSSDIGVVAYPIDRRDRTVYDIQHTIGQACFHAPIRIRIRKETILEHLIACRVQRLSLRVLDPSQTA